jgi:glycolate oxidase iron-sulfur subunit
MFAPLRQHILVQDPCSLRNVLRAEQAVYRLLERVPELRITPLPGNNVCCGGAGGYVLREPELAERLRAPKLDAIAELRPDFVVSANIGCALHVAAGLRRKRLALPVVHPAVLLARQLRPA